MLVEVMSQVQGESVATTDANLVVRKKMRRRLRESDPRLLPSWREVDGETVQGRDDLPEKEEHCCWKKKKKVLSEFLESCCGG